MASQVRYLPEATVLLKTLRSMKSVKVKQVNYEPRGAHQAVALLDGGATHGLRTAEAWERGELEPVQVELASGSTWLYRHKNHRTLLSLEEVEPIVPLHRLVLGSRLSGARRVARSSTLLEESFLVLCVVVAPLWIEVTLFFCCRRWTRSMALC